MKLRTNYVFQLALKVAQRLDINLVKLSYVKDGHYYRFDTDKNQYIAFDDEVCVRETHDDVLIKLLSDNFKELLK